MNEHKSLTWDIQVTYEWPVETGRLVIIKLVRKAVREHPFDQRIVITINNVLALITGRPKYTLEKIEHESDENTCYIDLFLPVHTSVVMLKFGDSYVIEKNADPFLSEDIIFDHPISRLFGSSSAGHRFAVATSNLRKPQQLVQIPENSDVSVEKISEDEWKIVCVDRLIKPQQSWCSRNVVQPIMQSPLFQRR